LTSRVPQHRVAMHAGIAAGALQRILVSDEASIAIWHSGSDLEVGRFQVTPSAIREYRLGDWTLVTDEHLLGKLAELRGRKSKKETGGVLVGSFDHRNQRIYVFDTIASPPDSEEWPTMYVRGCKGLKEQTDEISRKLDGQMQYVGEWHSHPEGFSTDPSGDDQQVFAWITEHMALDGHPAVMFIVGEKETRVFVASMEQAARIPRTKAQKAICKAGSSRGRKR
jgi:integrative and conjugative element protein (TIGR02256 family)